MPRPLLTPALAVASAALILSACGGAESVTVESAAPSEPAAVEDSASPKYVVPDADDSADSADSDSADGGPSEAAKAKPPVPGAYPGAGGARPAEAKEITARVEGTPAITTPSGNIGCDFYTDGDAGCGVHSYIETGQYGEDVIGPNWWIPLSDGKPSIVSKGDAPYFAYDSAQVVGYGEVVYTGDYVCASLETGLTCWNTKTGHGAHMNREGYSAF